MLKKTTRALLPALLMVAPAHALQAAPADVAAALRSKARPAEDLKLDAGRKPAEVLRFFGLERGDRALDLFTGTGYYAELIGGAVGKSGSVVAWEPANFYKEDVKKAWDALKGRVPNARLMVGTAKDISLAPASFDFVLMHMVYHDTYWESEKYGFPRMDPAAFLRQVYAATKPGGIVGVVDHAAEPGGEVRSVADKLHRIDPAVIRADFERAGFVLDGESDLLRNPADDRAKLVFDPAVRGKTDRVVYRFRKPAA